MCVVFFKSISNLQLIYNQRESTKAPFSKKINLFFFKNCTHNSFWLGDTQSARFYDMHGSTLHIISHPIYEETFHSRKLVVQYYCNKERCPHTAPTTNPTASISANFYGRCLLCTVCTVCNVLTLLSLAVYRRVGSCYLCYLAWEQHISRVGGFDCVFCVVRNERKTGATWLWMNDEFGGVLKECRTWCIVVFFFFFFIFYFTGAPGVDIDRSLTGR